MKLWLMILLKHLKDGLGVEALAEQKLSLKLMKKKMMAEILSR